MTPGEWSSYATLAVLLITQVFDRNKKRFEELEKALAKRIDEIREEISRVRDRQERDTDELKAVTGSLRTDVEVIKKTCKIMHRHPDSTDPIDAPHISQIRREVAR